MEAFASFACWDVIAPEASATTTTFFAASATWFWTVYTAAASDCAMVGFFPTAGPAGFATLADVCGSEAAHFFLKPHPMASTREAGPRAQRLGHC